MRTRVLIVILGCFVLASCQMEMSNGKNMVLWYDNFSIYSDLSNRMNYSPVDTAIIDQIVDHFVEECVRPGIKINDRSAISFSKMNHFDTNCGVARIDLSDLDGQLGAKQKFVNGRGDNSLQQSIDAFKKVVSCNYLQRDESGLDLLTLLNLEIENGQCSKDDFQLIGQLDTVTIKYTNHVFLFTDGYLEFNRKMGNPQFYFGAKKLSRLRAAVEGDQLINVEEFLKNNPEYGLPATRNSRNSSINLYVLETYDRGLNTEKGTLLHAGPYSDNNLLKAVWSDWAQRSGFRSFNWRMIVNANNLPQDYIRGMIKENQNTD